MNQTEPKLPRYGVWRRFQPTVSFLLGVLLVVATLRTIASAMAWFWSGFRR